MTKATQTQIDAAVKALEVAKVALDKMDGSGADPEICEVWCSMDHLATKLRARGGAS